MNRPFNLPIELGLRTLFILNAFSPEDMDVQKLTYLDYLLVHSGDVADGPESLHAPVPNRGNEWLVKRELIGEGLIMMVRRELLQIHFSKNGITYSASDLTDPFLKHFESPYSAELASRSVWLSKTFKSYSYNKLEKYMVKNLRKWGAEYKQESIFWEMSYE